MLVTSIPIQGFDEELMIKESFKSQTKQVSLLKLDACVTSGLDYFHNYINKVDFCDMASDGDDEKLNNSDLEHDDDSKSQKGPTVTPRNHKGKTLLVYNKRGVPTGEGAKKLSTFEGMVARSMVPITYPSWLDVPDDINDDLWKYTLTHFEVDPKSRAQVLQSMGIKWRNFNYVLNKKFIKPYKKDSELKRNPHSMYPFIKKKVWKRFVKQKTSKEAEDQSERAKNVRAMHKYNHRLSRKGYAGLIADIMKETGKTEEEIDKDRANLWKKARRLKTGGFDPEVQSVVDKIDKLTDSTSGEVTGSYDVLTQALGTEEPRGHVRGMGKFVTPQQYFRVPRTVKQLSDMEKKVDKRFNKLEEEIEKLKRGSNVSEGASCHMDANVLVEFEDEPGEELLDDSCLLAVDVALNIVAKGTITNHNVLGENMEVLMDVCLQANALLPIPPEDDPSMLNVKDAVGYILSWPRNLVIRCADLEKVAANKRMRNTIKPLKEIEGKKENKRLRDEVNENAKDNANRDVEKKRNKKEGLQDDDGKKNEKEGKVNENEHADKDEEFRKKRWSWMKKR